MIIPKETGLKVKPRSDKFPKKANIVFQKAQTQPFHSSFLRKIIKFPNGCEIMK